MSAIPQHILNAQKAALDNFLAVQGAVFGGFERLADLNLKVIKATLDEVAEKSQQAVEMKDAQEAMAFTSGLVQPNAEKALAYGKHVYDIVSAVQADLSKLAEQQIVLGQQQVNDAIDQLAKNAPTGSEGAVALMKSSLATANNAYEGAVKAARQVADAAESNINAATTAGFKAASDAAEAASKAAPRARRANA
ncbi:TIGR01841 family phasin [Parapusillimonas granuli]|uniref:TIGR01841 family phasin n=1 Tax=Parapusillimonas granuli TaxID=380911 RepID=A0A853FZ86_9BURK|nr:TIGR01841 family phasin [Parapusillimonas granuli]MBB5215060.1 phasin family protein [Parapusillimonas granuli]MEB2401367.1 TIGR01841 family phasin [Alcaligenaceae bacterium]NYT49379.1 TIGR01841 family phasin [Parapusillimonas granuli]